MTACRGRPGATGATRPAFTSFTVDAVNTLPPDNQATVTTSFDGTTVRFTFGIPQGRQGNNGFDGSPGQRDRKAARRSHRRTLAGTANNTDPSPPSTSHQRPADARGAAAGAGEVE